MVAPSDQWNPIYYGKPVNATDILVRMSVHNKQASELLNLLTEAASPDAGLKGISIPPRIAERPLLAHCVLIAYLIADRHIDPVLP